MGRKLLIEIGVEELPAIPLLKELPNIENKWAKILTEYHLESEFVFFYTPRRLVFFHEFFKEKQEDSFVEFIGAPKNIAYKCGKLTQAGQSFLQKANISESELQFKEFKGKEVLYYKSEVKGSNSDECLPMMIEQFLKSLNFGKTMRWGEGKFEFIRAIRHLVCILDDKLVECEIFGVKSAKKTSVHRSVSYDLFSFRDTEDYFQILEKNYVILDPLKRKEKILYEFAKLEKENDIKIIKDDELFAEVVAITEFPKVLLGKFEKEYLEIPNEVISTSMRENQRYFSVSNKGKLSNNFVVVSNAVCEEYSKIINGNERVLRARLSDAMFFYKNDLHNKLDTSKLSRISFLEGLGSLKDKVEREKKVAAKLCEIYNFDNLKDIFIAIDYAKADLTTQMVYEFGNLQGVMGYYYAKAEGFDDAICLAIKEQYLPNSEKSELPHSLFSSIVALSNKIDTLMSLFSVGKIPSGTKDPYALRRAANGILKIVLNLNQSFDIEKILITLAKEYKDFNLQALKEFIFERLFTFYDVNTSFVKAVLSSKNNDIIHIDCAVKALIKQSKEVNFYEKFSTFKRLANMVLKTDKKVDESLFIENEEKELYSAFKSIRLDDIEQYLNALFALKSEIDAFFDRVMINVEDEKLKNNRQALVYEIYQAFLKIADIKELSL